MSAGLQLQAGLVGLLGQQSELTGAYDGPPARAGFPYVVVDCGTARDRSTKDRRGREVDANLTIWDDQPRRLQTLADRIETMLCATSPDVAGWALAGWLFTGRKTNRDVAGPWSMVLDFRARLLEQD